MYVWTRLIIIIYKLVYLCTVACYGVYYSVVKILRNSVSPFLEYYFLMKNDIELNFFQISTSAFSKLFSIWNFRIWYSQQAIG